MVHFSSGNRWDEEEGSSKRSESTAHSSKWTGRNITYPWTALQFPYKQTDQLNPSVKTQHAQVYWNHWGSSWELILWHAQPELHQKWLYITSCVLTSTNKITWCKNFPLVTWLTPSLFFNCYCQCGNHGNGRFKPVCDIGLILQSQAGFRYDGKCFGLLLLSFLKWGSVPPEGRLTCWASTYLSVAFGKSWAYDRRVCGVWHLSTQLSAPPPSHMASGHLLCPLSWARLWFITISVWFLH